MAFSSSSSSLSATPNVTPLIDVLLVLLIIFMTIVPVSSRGLETVLPPSSATFPKMAEVPPSVLSVQAPRQAGQPIRYRVDGTEVDLHQLRPMLQQVQARSLSRAILIGGDPQLDFQPVASAISEAQQAGFRTIGLLPRSSQTLR